MLSRWCNEVNNLNLVLFHLRRLAQNFFPEKKGRGRKPKHSVNDYAIVIALKEFDKRTLRGAEMHLSKLICNERVDHSVIAYWENKSEVRELLAEFTIVAGAMLDKVLSTLFTFVDSTKFTSWNINETEITVCNKIANETVYPVGVSFRRETVASAVAEAVPDGEGKIKADAWYDVNEVFKVLFEKGYTPIVCPNKNRLKGFYRRKGRKLYRMRENRLAYKQRGRGESVFGSLTNNYGDRLHARKEAAMQTRIAARVLSYQIKLLIRASVSLIRIVRHAP